MNTQKKIFFEYLFEYSTFWIFILWKNNQKTSWIFKIFMDIHDIQVDMIPRWFRCLLNVKRASPGPLRRGTACGNAAPQPSSPGPIQPVRSSLHAYRLDAKHAEALKPSILILITPPCFRFSSNFLVHARCVALVIRNVALWRNSSTPIP